MPHMCCRYIGVSDVSGGGNISNAAKCRKTDGRHGFNNMSLHPGVSRLHSTTSRPPFVQAALTLHGLPLAAGSFSSPQSLPGFVAQWSLRGDKLGC